MTDMQVEISKIEIDPNRLRSYTKVDLPDFAVAALQKNGITYNDQPSGSGISEHNLQHTHNKCKLTQHIRSIESHLDKDGPRTWNGGAHSNVRDPLHGKHP